MRIILLLLCIWLLPNGLYADVLKYVATGTVSSVENFGTDADGLVSEGENVTMRFTLDTGAVLGAYENHLPDWEVAHYEASYPIAMEFGGGFSFVAVPPSDGPWFVGEQARSLAYIDNNQTFAEHYTGHNSEGTVFNFSEPLVVDWIDLLTHFQEYSPPFELTSTDLSALPPIDAFDETGFSFFFNDWSTGGYTAFVGYFDSLSLVPSFSCQGFLPPMHEYPVKVKKNRVLPHKMLLFSQEGDLITDADLAAPPVMEVTYQSTIEEDPVDVSDEALPAGNSSEGNQFVFTEEGYWQLNLSTRNYSASGIYTVRAKSGDEWEYQVIPTCETRFVVN